MTKNPVIAVCGKGGVGKTTLTALLARLLAAGRRSRVLAVDADPAVGLSMALGIKPAHTLDDLRRELIDSVEQAAGDPTDLLAEADYRLLEILEERDRIAFLSVGRPEEEGCYCKLNTFLRTVIERLGERFDVTLVDAEAGIEQVNRRVMRSVSHLLLVSDLSLKGLRVAESIAAVAARSGDPTIGLVINRSRDEGETEVFTRDISLPLLAALPEDRHVADFDARGRSLLELPPCDVIEAIETRLLGHGTFFA